MIYCANLSVEDFYVIHHELGHIQYYMAYKDNLPTLFLVCAYIRMYVYSIQLHD